MDLIIKTPQGLFCPPGNFFIDPHKAVQTAVISHAHTDHARSGHHQYIATGATIDLIELRTKKATTATRLEYGQVINLNGVNLSLHPAGHVWGSAQIRLEYNGEVWVYTGDYKLTNDSVSKPYEQLECDVFITESTFGLPVFHWQDDLSVSQQIHSWLDHNKSLGLTSIVAGYSLGKSQRIIKMLDLPNAFAHKDIHDINSLAINSGVSLPQTILLPEDVSAVKQSVLFIPPGATKAKFLTQLVPYSLAYISGWMALPRMQQMMSADQSFVISDHPDWEGLIKAVLASKAKRVLVLHGFTAELSRYLQETYNLDASPLESSSQSE